MSLSSYLRRLICILASLCLLIVCSQSTKVTPTSTSAPTLTTAASAFREKVDIGEYELFITCKGEGSPTVVLDAGWTQGAKYWTTMTTILSRISNELEVMVCAYDRLGIGDSDPAPKVPRTNLDMAQELHQLLHKAEVPEPYVYVGASLSGFTGRLFATEYPDELAGLVLIDPSHPDWDAKVLELLPPESADEPETVTDLRYEFTVRRRDPMILQEYWDIDTSAELVRESGSLGDLPLVILMRDTSKPELQLEFNKFFYSNPDFSLLWSEKLDSFWPDLMGEIATLSSNSTLIVAEGTNHNIPMRNSDSVVDAIRLILEDD